MSTGRKDMGMGGREGMGTGGGPEWRSPKLLCAQAGVGTDLIVSMSASESLCRPWLITVGTIAPSEVDAPGISMREPS